MAGPRFGPAIPRVRTPTVKTPRPKSLIPTVKIGVSAPKFSPPTISKKAHKRQSVMNLPAVGRRSL